MAQTPNPTAHGPLCTAPGCGEPSPDAFVGRSCLDQLHRDLRAIAGQPVRRASAPAVALGLETNAADSRRGQAADARRGLAEHLLITMTRQDVVEDRVGVREPGLNPLPTDQPIAEVALPYAQPAGDVLADMQVTLNMWVRVLIDRRGLPGAEHPGADVVELALWLDRHRQSVAADQDGGQIVAEVGRLVGRAERVVFPRTEDCMGPCNHWHCETGPDGCVECRAREVPEPRYLYVERGAVTVTCPVCGRSYDTAERRRWLLEQAEALLMTAEDASWAVQAYLGTRLSVRKIQDWGQHGRVARYVPHPGDRQLDRLGRPKPPGHRYKVSDLVAVLLAGQVAQGDHHRADSTQPGEPVQQSTC